MADVRRTTSIKSLACRRTCQRLPLSHHHIVHDLCLNVAVIELLTLTLRRLICTFNNDEATISLRLDLDFSVCDSLQCANAHCSDWILSYSPGRNLVNKVEQDPHRTCTSAML